MNLDIHLPHGENRDRAVRERWGVQVSLLSVLWVGVWGGTWFRKHLQPEQELPDC